MGEAIPEQVAPQYTPRAAAGAPSCYYLKLEVIATLLCCSLFASLPDTIPIHMERAASSTTTGSRQGAILEGGSRPNNNASVLQGKQTNALPE